jgi:diaminopimelate decarboxylase
MDFFTVRNGELYAEEVPVAVIAKEVGTPCYIYSRATLERHWHAFNTALGDTPHTICYAVKANSHIAVLNVLARLGSGFDIVSGGELARVIAAGGDPRKTIFSGVGKLPQEILAALKAQIGCFNVESEAELQLINDIAQQHHYIAPIALRVNPNVDAKTHPYISTGLKENKFGIDMSDVMRLYQYAATLPSIKIEGIACHIGSQLTSTQPFVDALAEILRIYDDLQQQGIPLEHIDLGGGLGVTYQQETPPSPEDYAKAIKHHLGDRKVNIVLEPGRAIAANAGILITQVLLLKHQPHKNFAVVDAGMNDLLRPALYEAWHQILPVKAHANPPEKVLYDIVGPVCETADFLGKERSLAIKAQDLLAIRSAGAYGFTMSSNYNTRARAAEVMVDKDYYQVIRPRETIENLFASERLLP